MLDLVDNDDVRRARHDLRTVVNHLQGYTTLLQEEDVGWTREREIVQALELIYETSHEILRIIDLAAPDKRKIAPADLLSQLRADLRAPSQAVQTALTSIAENPPAAEHPDVQRLRKACQRLGDFINQESLAAEGTPQSTSPKVVEVSASARILVIEDDDGNRDLLERMLRRYSYDVVGTGTGAAALRCIARERFDLILLDLLLPDMDGFSLLQRLRNEAPLAPVIVISALNDMDNITRCIEAGAEDYFAKPFIPILLRTRVASALDRMRYRALLAQATPGKDTGEITEPQRTLNAVAFQNGIRKVG